MDLSAFQLLKNNARTNANNRLHDTPIVQYGRIIRVIDVQTVICEAVIQTSLSREVYTATLLNLSSSILETAVWPKLGDTVLLLFLQRYDPRMFVAETVNNPNAAGYNRFSGIGILMSTIKGAAGTVITGYEDETGMLLDIKSGAHLFGSFTEDVVLTFCRAVFNSDDEQLISLVFGAGRPFRSQHLAKVEREYGFQKDTENELVELDAAVAERFSRYAPVVRDIQGTQTIGVGLGIDKDGKPVETEAAVNEVIHGKAPVARDIRSPQTITIGIGNDESGDAEEQRDAAVTITLGEQADIDFESASGITAYIEKDVDVGISGSETRNIEGDKEESVTGKAKYSSADTDIESTAPIGLNAGLYTSALKPYLNAETAAAAALGQAAITANAQLAVLDAVSGGIGTILALGAAIAAFTEAVKAMDTAAHTALTPIVK